MRYLHRLALGFLPLLLLFSTVFSSIPLLTERAEAASTYSYTAATNACLSDTQIMIKEVDGQTVSLWCFDDGTTYEFTRSSGSSGRITVSGNTPDTGSLNSGGQTSEISIANTPLFAQTFPETVASNDEEGQSCENAGGVMGMGWIMCPLIGMVSGAINWLDTRIQSMLEVNEDRYTNPELKTAWKNFRNLAYAILIPMMLVMVIGTALGTDMFSAYTVKKALPRMVLAAIFITLSWHITVFLISFFNVIGGGILGLMTSPFGMGGNMSLDSLFGQGGGSAALQWTATLGVLAGLAGLAMSPGGLPILLMYLVPAALFVLGAFLVLVLREIFILAGVLLAPVAIISWVFPGNDGLWKLWWQTFSKLLLMFPLIMIIIGAGRIAAHLIGMSGGGGIESLIVPLLKLTAYILPYMFIPFAFKFAGGVFANLAGMVNDREKGVFDRMKKKRGEAWGEYARRGGRNSIYDPYRAANAKGLKGFRMRATNKVGGWVFDPLSNANVALGTEKGQTILSQVWQGKAEDSQKLAEVMGRMSFNAEELSALSVGRSISVRGANGQIVKEKIAAWDGTGADLNRLADDLARSTDAQDQIGARHLRENAGFLLQITRSDEYGRADVRAAAALAYASQGFAKPEEIAWMAQELGQGGSGLGSIFKTQAELLSARGGGLGKPGYGIRIDAQGNYTAPSGIDGAKIEQLVRSGVQDFSAAKGSQLTGQLGEAMVHVLTASSDTEWVGADGNINRIGDIKTGVEETLVQVMGSYAAPDVKRRVYKILVDAKTTNLANTGLGAAEARAAAEQEINRLLQRSSGNINYEELNAAEQARMQQEDKNH